MRLQNNAARPRAGFTLIELIAIIGILVILMAIGAGAYFRVSASQQKKTNEAQVFKLLTAFDQQWKSVIESARKGPMTGNGTVTVGKTVTPVTDFEPYILQWCGYDNARARALWVKIRLWQEFPHRFTDVRRANGTQATATFAPTTVNDPTGVIMLPGISILAKQAYYDAFAGVAALDNPVDGVCNTESAVLLYAILSTGRGGMSANIDEMMGQSGLGSEPTTKLKVFQDTYGTPIAFRRFGNQHTHKTYISELSAPPYVAAGSVSLDPLDPEGKLQLRQSVDWFGGTTAARALFVPAATQVYRDYYLNAPAPHTPFPNANFGPFIFSAGPDKKYHDDSLVGTSADTSPVFSGAFDDIVSYRLRRTGERGD